MITVSCAAIIPWEVNTMADNTLIRTEDLCVWFPVRRALPFGKRRYVKAVDNVSITIEKGETFGLVGESGCGKSTLANALLGMQKPTAGKVYFKGKDLNALSIKDFKEARRDMQMIFQDPFSSLDPRWDVYRLISEPMYIRGGYTKEQMEQEVLRLLKLVGLNEDDLHRYPSEFSGGQRQRIGIARAISLHPDFLVCDEPVSALDVSVHAQILNLLMELQQEMNMTYLFISHNLAVVKDICKNLCVMYLGQVMETGDTQEIFNNPLHPYTRSLLSAVLSVNLDEKQERMILKGEIPSPIDAPKGCRFCTRCPYASEKCHQETPRLQQCGEKHFIACHFPGIGMEK